MNRTLRAGKRIDEIRENKSATEHTEFTENFENELFLITFRPSYLLWQKIHRKIRDKRTKAL
jgi:hypothetical protein